MGLQMLAVRAEPAEAAPGQEITYTALLVDASGQRADAAIDWAYCSEPKPQAELDGLYFTTRLHFNHLISLPVDSSGHIVSKLT